MEFPASFSIRLLHDCVISPPDQPRGVARHGKAGEIIKVPVEMPRWEAAHLCQCHPEFPRAEVVKGK